MSLSRGSGFVTDGRTAGKTLIKVAFADPDQSGDNAFIAAVAGKKIRVLAYRLQASGTVEVRFADTDSDDLSMAWELQAREGVTVASQDPGFEFESPVGTGVQVNLSGAVEVHVSVQYVEIDG
jgi:hypothetical protein